MLNKSKTWILLATLVCLSSCKSPQQQVQTDVYEGWRLGMETWPFRRFTLYEAIDKTAALGLHWIEIYPGQVLSSEKPDIKMGHNISPEIRAEVKRKLAESNVRLVSYALVRPPEDKSECRKLFAFAKDMGIEIIVSEPPPQTLDFIESLCKEFKIKLAIHNHPKPSQYWNPDTVLALCQGRSKWIGVCADTGHWVRSGLEPVKEIKKIRDRIVSLHLKDVGEFGNPEAHDIVWGTGKGDVKGILAELHQQNFKGPFIIEYEHNWEDSMPEIRQCVQYFNTVAGKLKAGG